MSSTNTGRFKLFRQLQVDGLTEIFGNPGTSEQNLLDLLRFEEFSDFKYYLGLHEGPVVAMADAWARCRQKPAIVQLHSYAGLANGLGMMYYAKRGYSPMVVLAGEAGLRYEAMDAQMSADLVNLARPFVKCDHNGPCAWRVTDENSVLRLLRRAIKCAATPPYGPVFLALPMDVLERECPEECVPTSIPDAQVQAAENALRTAAEWLAAAEHPVILIGDGVAATGGMRELQTLAETLGATVLGGNHSEVNFSSLHPLYGGDTGHMFGPHSKALLAGADVVLVAGTTVLPEVFPLLEGVFAAGARVLQFDLNTAELAKNFPVSIAAVGNPRLVFSALAPMVRERLTPAQQESVRRRTESAGELHRSTRESQLQADAVRPRGPWLHFSDFLIPLAERLAQDSRETLIFDEAITSSPELLRHLPPHRFGSYFQTRAGMLGTGLPGTVGLKAAEPEMRVIGFTGDGGAISTIQALGTAARHRLGAKFVICNNRSYRILNLNIQEYWQDWLKEPADQPFPVPFDLAPSHLRFDLLARGHGVEALRVEKPEEIAGALDAMLADDHQPFLIDLLVE